MTSTTPKAKPEPTLDRDPYFDNAKFLAVVLVVFGHAWEPLRGANVGGRPLEAAQTLVYGFHLPAFIVMCGYFSRGFATRAAAPASSSPRSSSRT